jgi:hypothetical protein
MSANISQPKIQDIHDSLNDKAYIESFLERIGYGEP